MVNQPCNQLFQTAQPRHHTPHTCWSSTRLGHHQSWFRCQHHHNRNTLMYNWCIRSQATSCTSGHRSRVTSKSCPRTLQLSKHLRLWLMSLSCLCWWSTTMLRLYCLLLTTWTRKYSSYRHPSNDAELLRPHWLMPMPWTLRQLEKAQWQPLHVEPQTESRRHRVPWQLSMLPNYLSYRRAFASSYGCCVHKLIASGHRQGA
mmetsp:Transcript_12487/g.18062  ORF Transcript_12487/g.18062 Transcript_12487/m.18062 type:complete len:202 (+) Transcript_12487:20-625(+)